MYVAIGMSVVMLVGQERTRLNALLGAATLMVGLAIGTTPSFLDKVDPTDPQLLARLQGLFEVGAVVTYAMYLLGLLALSSLTGRRARVVRICGWTAIGLGAWHAIASFAWPAQRLNDFELSLGDPGFVSRPGFWLFATFWLVTVVPYALGWILLALGDLDPAEVLRARAYAAASAIVIAVTVVPPALTTPLLALWISLGIFGQMQYETAHAQRGVFLSRFLSPRVTELVAAHGLAETMKPHPAEITVVSADLRGFTPYSEGVPSKTVVDLLADYYDAVGDVVASHGGTITNYAGDGILILIGAPIADPNHAATGIQLARDLLLAVQPVLTRWQTEIHTLGLGVGVASGSVTVGAISAATRMEYTAVGMPVNLAARLCAAAKPDEVLIDAEAARLSKVEDLRGSHEMTIKGFSDVQLVYALER
jgi:class 3 adenylate cyclase